jgi:hypothetical protein
MKYVGIWWEMHVGKLLGILQAHKMHKIHNSRFNLRGATTENTKRYIDFAAKNGFDGVLVKVGIHSDWFEIERSF